MMSKQILNSIEMEIINKIKTERIRHGLSQKELAEKAGVKRPYLGLIESFHKKPTKNVIVKIAEALNLDIGQYKKLFEEQKINKESIDFIMPIIKLSDKIINKIDGINKLSKYVFLPYKTAEFVNYSEKKYLYAYIMPDDSMEPIINKNDILIIEFFESDIFFNDDSEEDLAAMQIIDGAVVVVIDDSGLTLIRKIITISSDSLDYLPDEDERKNKILFAILEASNKNYYDIDIPVINPDIKFKIDPQTKKIERLKKIGDFKIKGIIIAVISERLLYNKEDLRYF